MPIPFFPQGAYVSSRIHLRTKGGIIFPISRGNQRASYGKIIGKCNKKSYCIAWKSAHQSGGLEHPEMILSSSAQ
jgi:hypothetical protein